jgi:AcrR family transcriptional regulator
MFQSCRRLLPSAPRPRHSTFAIIAAVTTTRIDSNTRGLRRTRRSGHTRLQQEQKETVRRQLLDAAQAAFAELSYVGTGVEDIATRAGVSRTSFYRHFDSKWAIACALIEAIKPEIYALWAGLAAGGNPGARQLREWLDRFLGYIAAHRSLMITIREVETNEYQSFIAVMATHAQIIELLAAGIPAFRPAAQAGPEHEAARVAAHMLLMQFDQFCYVLGVRGWAVDRQIAIDVMVRNFRRFLADFRPAR